jgi:hypothetical protein
MLDIVIDLICGFFLFSISLIFVLTVVESMLRHAFKGKKAYHVFSLWGTGAIIIFSLLYASLNRFGMA